MDFIDDFEEESDNEAELTEHSNETKKIGEIERLLSAVFIELMKLKPHLKAQKKDIILTEVLLPKEVVIVIPNEISNCKMYNNTVEMFMSKLRAAKFDRIYTIEVSSITSHISVCDIFVDLQNLLSNVESDAAIFHRHLMPGGKLITICTKSNLKQNYNDFDWIVNIDGSNVNVNAVSEVAVHTIQKRCIHCNETAAIYWRNVENKVVLEAERRWIETVSVPILVSEYVSGVFSDSAHKRAVHNIVTHGVCIFPHLFNAQETLNWGAHAKQDMKEILRTLKNSRGIDLLNPASHEGQSMPRIENFHELSMREALRCDLRNGKLMKIKANSVYGETKNEKKNGVNYHTHLPPSDNLRFHPAILAVLSEAMNPPAPTEHEQKGNWGRYNFEGPGPEVIPQPKIGQLGVVMSLPGCADQTIHADTSHIYVHTHLPPHYLNLFTPAIARDDVAGRKQQAVKQKKSIKSADGEDTSIGGSIEFESYEVGQTAFVVGSQTLDVAGRVMTTEQGQALLEERLIRPQLTTGDALIFDCRILHFGLANQAAMMPTSDVLQSKDFVAEEANDNVAAVDTTSQGWRPMLYVNYHQDWFHDPKNWNDNEKLFEENK